MADTFTLDTSGRVAGTFEGLAVWYEFDDLHAFTQGYVGTGLSEWHAALLARAISRRCTVVLPQFRHLAPATLAEMMADCARARTTPPGMINSTTDGRIFWKQRQDGMWSAFPPVTLYLGDDSLIYQRVAS